MRRNLLLTVVIVVGMLAVGAALFVASPATDSAEADPIMVQATGSTTTTEAGPTPAEVDAWVRAANLHTWNQAVWVNTTNRNLWVATTEKRLAAERAAAERVAAAKRAATIARSTPKPVRPSVPVAEHGSGRCGGSLPPCWVMMRESRGNIRAQNPRSSASGKWQFIRSTWAGFGGYAEAWQAPESVQDAKARIVWAGGRGCGNWAAC